MLLFLVAFILPGCTHPSALPEETKTATYTINPSSTPMRTKTPSSTFTATIEPSTTATPGNSPTPNHTPTVSTTANILRRCIDIQFESYKDIVDFQTLSGNLIMDVLYSKSDYKFNFTKMVETGGYSISSRYDLIQPYRLSPDHDWGAFIAIVDYHTDQARAVLVVQSADGQTSLEFPHNDPKEGDSIAQWLDNEWLVLARQKSEVYDHPILFNPFTGEKKEMTDTYPDVFLELTYWETSTLYEPNLSRVVYLKSGTKIMRNYIVYWDIKQNKAIFEYHTDGWEQPAWSPDGKSFIFIKRPSEQKWREWKDELILSDWDGNLSQLTDFTEYYDYSRIRGYYWSPDGQSIALIFNTNEARNADLGETTAYLFVLNVENKSIVDYCVPLDSTWVVPVWSPDSKYIAISYQEEDITYSKAIVINLETGAAIVLANELEPMVWMK